MGGNPLTAPFGKVATAVAIVLSLLPVLSAAESPSPGPRGVTVLAPGFTVEEVALVDGAGDPVQLQYPTSLAFRGNELLVVEGGRFHYASPFQPALANGRIVSIALTGATGTATSLASGLADPLGLAVDATGRVYFTQYGRISTLAVDGTVHDFTVDLPPQVADFVFAPVDDGGRVGDVLKGTGQGDLIDVNTTGPMGLAFAPDGTLYSTQSTNGRPPDDPLVGGRDYAVDYSSSILTPRAGPVDPSMVYARGCRNCYDLVVTEDGRIYASENAGLYRARLQAGHHRTALEGSSLADGNHMDSVVEVTPGQVRRVATILPNSGTLGAAPTGLALAPASFPAGTASRLFVAIYSGLPESTPEDGADDRGYVAMVEPEPVTGLGPVVPFVAGLDFPMDVAFGPDGAMYVIEYYSGRLYRVAPTGGSA